MSRFILQIAGVFLLQQFCVGVVEWHNPANGDGSCGDIDENAQPGAISTVMVNATSQGATIAGYAVSDGSNNVVFSFNPQGEGTLVSGTIDYESVKYLTFVVTATDDSTSVMSGTATCNVTVNNINDNKPVFGTVTTPTIVPNGTAQGANVAMVTATDADGDDIEFSITAGNADNDLIMNLQTGQITAGKLLVESDGDYMLTITATDKGTPPMSATAALTVCVGSCYENAAIGPAFSLLCLMASMLVSLYI